MERFAGESFTAEVPQHYLVAFDGVWDRIGQAGEWLTARERVNVVRTARTAEPRPLWDRRPPLSEIRDDGMLLVDTIERIATEAGSLDRSWFEVVASRLGVGVYAEVVALIALTVPVDRFCRLLGRQLEPLPDPSPGEPTRVVPDGLGDIGGWLPMTDPYEGANVARSLSYVPEDNRIRLRLVRALYSGQRFGEMVWTDSAMSRPQVELVAARTSALNECFY